MRQVIMKLYPAYGRGYLIPSSLEHDWLAGKDFSATVLGGPYTSIRDFKYPRPQETQAVTHVLLRDVRNKVEITLEVKDEP
jgi:hypothetical protein